MTFKPSIHGWAFQDTHALTGAGSGLGTTPPLLGFGGGMCWAALDRYLDGRAIPDASDTPAPDSPLHAELQARQVAALAGVWPRVRQWQGIPDGSWRDRLPVPLTPGRGDAASLTRREWTGIRRSLRSGTPVLLTLVEADDPYARPIAARQVLAYAWEREAGSIVLSIYDPTRPGNDDARLAFSMRGSLDARLTGGHRIRGFFAVPYDRAPAAALRPETFADRSVIGLNRRTHGRPAAAATLGGLHIVARDPEGALIHFRRRYRRAHWDGAKPGEREDMTGFELHADPVAHPGPAAIGIHAFSRSYVGDLLHFRLLRRWTAANRTEHRRAGPRFRLEGNPVPAALPWGGVCVVGRGKEGALVAYSGVPFRGWRAEEVPAAGRGALTGDPVAARLGATVQVVGRSREGHLLHFERTRGGWSAGDLMKLCPGTEPVSGAPVLIVHDGRAHIFARTADHALLHLVRDGEGQWTSAVVARGIAGDPVATAGPAGLHVFATGVDGGLVHARLGERWRVEDLTATRPGIAAGAAPQEGLVAWGSSDELRVLGRGLEGLVHWVWRPDSDWVAGPLAERAYAAAEHEPGEDPRLVVDRSGGFHVVATDGAGTVVHLEAGAWRAATERWSRSGSRAARRPPASADAGPPAEPAAPAKPAAGKGGTAGKRGAKRAASPAPKPAAGLPLLDDPEVEASPGDVEDEQDVPAVDLPMLDVPDGTPPAEPELEPMDLDEILTWPSDPGSSKKSDRGQAPPPPESWPE